MSTERTLGDLLVRSGRISQTCQRDTLALAKQLGMPVRQVLIYSGEISKSHMYAALELFAMVSETFLPFDSAARALQKICESDIDVSLALKEVGYDVNQQSKLIRLGELLIQAGCIGPDDLLESLRVSREAACPLGHSLILLGFVPPAIVGAALTIQQGLRDKKIRSSEEAIRRLKAEVSFQRRARMPELLAEDIL